MAAIEFRLLGPLEVWCGGRQLAIGGRKPRLVLVMLLMRAGETVSTDRLIEALWGDRPPAGAPNALQAHVAALRRALAPARSTGVVVTHPPGYRLDIGAESIDAPRFERLLAQGRAALNGDAAHAAELLREALALWRGPALAEFAYEPFAAAEANRLDELRLSALEARADADLALGAHAELVPALETQLAEHPLRERTAAQLMTALYRCGRQADASRVFHATRTALVEELGMEPQPALRKLFQRVLDHDPELARPAAQAAGGPTYTGRIRRQAHNLPADATSFVGRERELREVHSLLYEGRLVTLTGVGGAGKTRLALQVARELVGEYPDGVWLVELAPLADPALVVASVAAVLGIRDRSGPLIGLLEERLRDSRVLVVLDNCEHLIDACAELAHALLRSCQGVRMIATSREPLKIAGEITWPVPGMAVPDAGSLPASAELRDYAAIRLFAERASAMRSGFALDANNAKAVTLLCRRLDGIPLAIELAAARVRALSPEEILRRLDDRFALLTGGGRDAAARQRTLRATIDWSHELLDPAERMLFRRLSVFAGGWTLAAAEEVCSDAGAPRESICDLHGELIAKSLVIADLASSGTTRYRMLDTLRVYADERLTEAGERAVMTRGHFRHFLALAEHAHELRQTRGLNAELLMIGAEEDNIRAALTFARTADPAGLLRLATASEQLWLAGRIREGLRWLRQALAAAPEPTLARVSALNTATALTTLQQTREEAHRLIDESLALAARLGDQAGEAGARLWLGFLELNADPPRYAELERSLAMHETIGDRVGTCHSLVFLGIAKSQHPATRHEALEALERAARMARELEDAWGEAFAQIFLGWAAAEDGDGEPAARHFAAAICTDALGPVRGTAFDGLASLAVERDGARALRLLAAATALRERDGGRPPGWLRRRGQAIRARAEALLDADTAREAWDQGRRMSTEQAIVYALAGSPESADSTSALDSQAGKPPTRSATSG